MLSAVPALVPPRQRRQAARTSDRSGSKPAQSSTDPLLPEHRPSVTRAIAGPAETTTCNNACKKRCLLDVSCPPAPANCCRDASANFSLSLRWPPSETKTTSTSLPAAPVHTKWTKPEAFPCLGPTDRDGPASPDPEAFHMDRCLLRVASSLPPWFPVAQLSFNLQRELRSLHAVADAGEQQLLNCPPSRPPGRRAGPAGLPIRVVPVVWSRAPGLWACTPLDRFANLCPTLLAGGGGGG